MSSLGKRIFNLAVALDQLLYVLLTLGAAQSPYLVSRI